MIVFCANIWHKLRQITEILVLGISILNNLLILVVIHASQTSQKVFDLGFSTNCWGNYLEKWRFCSEFNHFLKMFRHCRIFSIIEIEIIWCARFNFKNFETKSGCIWIPDAFNWSQISKSFGAKKLWISKIKKNLIKYFPEGTEKDLSSHTAITRAPIMKKRHSVILNSQMRLKHRQTRKF